MKSDKHANGHLFLSFQTLQVNNSAACTNQTNSLRIEAFSLGGSRDENILEEDPDLIEAQLVPAEQDIPHAVVHTINDKDELQKQEEQLRKDMKSQQEYHFLVAQKNCAMMQNKKNSPAGFFGECDDDDDCVVDAANTVLMSPLRNKDTNKEAPLCKNPKSPTSGTSRLELSKTK